jgi:hypothetical protein
MIHALLFATQHRVAEDALRTLRIDESKRLLVLDTELKKQSNWTTCQQPLLYLHSQKAKSAVGLAR